MMVAAAPAAVATGARFAQTPFNYMAAADVERNRQKALQNERERQDNYYRKANESLSGAIGMFDRGNQDETREQAAAKRTAATDKLIEDAPSYRPGAADTAPKAAQNYLADVMLKALSESKAYGSTLANMRGYTDTSLSNALGMNTAGQRIGMYGNFAQGSSQVLPMELMRANQAGQEWSTISDLLGLTGDLANLYSTFPQGPTTGQGGGSTRFAPSGQRRGFANGMFAGGV